MIYPIVVYGDAVLRKRATDIEKGTNLEQLILDMYETMHAAHGIGLAAPQIGKGIRLFVVDGTTLEDEPSLKDFKQAFINPVILHEAGTEWEFEEGCLSIPNIREDVSRKEKIKVKYFDQNWEQKVEEFDGMKARIIQHEYDHIEGILFTDRISSLKKRLISKKLQNIMEGKTRPDYKMKFVAKKGR